MIPESSLTEEKRFRNVSEGQLVFIGMHNVAQVRWCSMYAVLKSRVAEAEFFEAYVQDRTQAAVRRGLTAPGDADWPLIRPAVRELRLADVEPREVQADIEPQTIAPDLAAVQLAGNDPLELGERAENVVAEQYPSFRWGFQWRSYVLLGIPDGVTKSFVYEFKMARNPYLASVARESALTQADLYGLCFRRPRKRVQIYVRENASIETIDTVVEPSRAQSALKMFAAVDSGRTPQPPPEKWKCRKCEVRSACAIGRD